MANMRGALRLRLLWLPTTRVAGWLAGWRAAVAAEELLAVPSGGPAGPSILLDHHAVKHHCRQAGRQGRAGRAGREEGAASGAGS